MQKIIIFVSLVALASAGITDITKTNVDLFKYSPNDIYTLSEDVDDDKPPTIFNGEVMKAKTEVFENYNSGKKFKLQLKTQNGIDIESVGKLKDSKTFVVSGQYSFTGADGKRYKTRYTADEFGYHPMTELDLEIPEPIPAATPSKQNNFKFLNQNLRNPADFFAKPTVASTNILDQNLQAPYPQLGGASGIQAAGPLRGSGQSGDDYSLTGEDYSDHSVSGYNYAVPSRQYLPVFDEPASARQYNVPSLN